MPNCPTTISVKEDYANAKRTVMYDETVNKEYILGWTAGFNILETNGACPLSCELLSSDCNSENLSTKVFTDEPAAVYARRDIPAGYTETVCIKCSPDSGVTSKTWTLTVTQVQDCSGALALINNV